MKEEIEKYLRERIEEHFREVEFPQHYTWEDEEGNKYSAWKLGNLMLGDGAYEKFCQALKEEVNKL